MKILWVCSIPLPDICDKLGIPRYNIGGWIEGLAEMLKRDSNIDFKYACPQRISDKLIIRKVNNIDYYCFPSGKSNYEIFTKIINECKPDILHIFGTENPYAFNIAKVFSRPERTIINIQGIVSTIARHYTSGIPFYIVHRYTFRDLIKRNNLNWSVQNFKRNSINENKLIKYANNFVGRTDYDHAIVEQCNPNARYFKCNEILRKEFYKDDIMWDLDKCEKHSLFISQAHYPVKGLHFLIEAMVILKKFFPDIKLYIAGSKIRIIPRNCTEYIMQSSYARYLWKNIKENNLQNSIFFLGNLNVFQMKQRFVKSHVFVSCSSIENESNSLSESKLLGVPAVASFVGGVTGRINHGIDGFLYPHDEPYMLAFYLKEIFNNDELALEFSKNAKIKAKELFDPENNNFVMLKIYSAIMKEPNKQVKDK